MIDYHRTVLDNGDVAFYVNGSLVGTNLGAKNISKKPYSIS